ncbi:MAG: glucose-6-phosphate isomerase [Ekhidna sp.]|nr:glucose-6-phosphate isomerase [Ekhidna sp.]
MLPKVDPTTTKSWANLSELASRHKGNIKDLFTEESDRVAKYTHQMGDFVFDFSKNDVSNEVFNNLIGLANECNVQRGIEAQYSGEFINETENRSVLHISLRDCSQANPHLKEVRNELEKIKAFSQKLHSGKWLGYTGKQITDIVNIGIGGSDLGPKMVTHALQNSWKKIKPHFISNIDAQQLNEELDGLNPESTLFIIASKTFTTQETMTNADSAKNWFLNQSGKEEAEIAKHFVAVSTNKEAVSNFGIDLKNMFVFWDWVGGRYSLWSAIGLSIAGTVGYEKFEELLKGAHEMDNHFKEAPMGKNIPVIAALIGIWYNNFLNYSSLAILPYDHRLRFLPAYLQQADMESNGKYVNRNGSKVNYETGPILWGEPGTNGQHAFYQLIHQGTKIIPTEFIAFAKSEHQQEDHHEKLLANFFAQPKALLMGKSQEQVKEEMGDNIIDSLVPFRVFEGNRPSTSILIKELTPYNVGKLIAYYEHKIFVQGLIWNIFSYDQWGVELGKQLAKPILKEIKEQKVGDHDESTKSIIAYYFKMRN